MSTDDKFDPELAFDRQADAHVEEVRQACDNVIKLAAVNDKVKVKDEAATSLVVQFLRDYADSIEKGETVAESAVLILYKTENKDSTKFCVTSRRCNVDLLHQVGMMHLALADICEFSSEGFEDEEPEGA